MAVNIIQKSENTKNFFENKQVSFYKTIRETKPTKIMSLHSILNDIKTGKYQSEMATLRAITEKEEQSEYKKNTLPCFTLSGIFENKNDAGFDAKTYTNLLQIDIDEIGFEKAQELKEILKAEPYVLSSFISPRGNGLKVIVWHDYEPDEHKKAFFSFEKHFKIYFDVVIDTNCKNISRAFFVSDDRDLWLNENCIPLRKEYFEAFNELPTQTEANNTSKNFENVFDFCQYLTEQKYNFVEGSKSLYRLYLSKLLSIYQVSDSEIENYIDIHFSAQTGKNKTLYDVKSGIKYAQSENKRTFVPYSEYVAQKREAKQQKKKEKQDKANELSEWGDFYCISYNNKGEKVVTIDTDNFLKILQSLGIHRFDMEKQFIFILIKGKIVKEVTLHQITDIFMAYLEKNIKKEHLKLVKNKFLRGLSFYFGEILLARLTLKSSLVFVKDTQKESFIFYKNCVVVINANEIFTKPYECVEGYIWERQILPRNFELKEKIDLNSDFDADNLHNVFFKFCFLVAGSNKQNFLSLMTIIGYLLHDYKQGKRKAVVFTDSSLEMGNNGRSGKTLLGKALGYIRVYVELNGKNFENSDKNKYQQLELDTQIVNINDVTSYFNYEWVINDVTENIEVNKKYMGTFKISPKMIICTNKAIPTPNGSEKDRVIEFEFSEYFNEKHSPENEFGHWFFGENWNEKHWKYFDIFMQRCLLAYFTNGVILPNNTNLAKRKILYETSVEFVEFCESEKFEKKKEYSLKKLYEKFRQIYGFDEKRFSQIKFTKSLKLYVQYAKLGKIKERIERGIEYEKFISFE